MPETNNKVNKDQRKEPFQQQEGGLVVDSEYVIRQAFTQDVRRGYELLFKRYYVVLCNQAVRFTYSRDIAEDIVADVFLGFWKNRVHDHITTSYRSYLYKAVRNRVTNHLQEEFRRTSLLGEPVDVYTMNEATYEDPQHIIQCTELYQHLQTQIKLLHPQCQRVFVLSRFEGKKQCEIAEELQISVKAVEAHIQRALAQLKKSMPRGLLVGLLFWLLM